jgi:transcriptional regulator with XRE-family HTH domain
LANKQFFVLVWQQGEVGALSNNLKKIRRSVNKSLTQVSIATGIDRTTLCRIENGIRPLSQNKLEILCKYFNVTSDYMLGISKEYNQIPSSKKNYDNGDDTFCESIRNLTEDQKEIIEVLIKAFNEKNSNREKNL